ncbi:MAG: hypothetical protein HOP29_13255 [Phycisphaerales bacterium]|nr:hypothetical protein [Phycisphaerales bacterium]
MRTKPRQGVLRFVLYGWTNSVWCGIAVLIAIFVYSSLGSAIPTFRQDELLEMTEMEWFYWWPFLVLIAMLCVIIITVTLRQIPLRKMNAGVWMIHTGIITLALGSVYYFSTKVEGDVPVFRRRVVIQVPGAAEPASMVVRPGNHLAVSSGADEYHFSVQQVFPEWTIASGADEGKTAMMTWVEVVTPTQKFTRQLLAGYPQYTEDILPDRTRAKKTLGKPLVDETLTLSLDYEPQTDFYVMDSAAIYARDDGARRWIERPIEGLPHYHERIASYDDVYVPSDEAYPLRPIDLAISSVDAADPLAGYDVRVNSFLRYAFLETNWHDHGEQLNPVADVSLTAPASGGRADYQLVAFDAERRSAESGMLVFRWVESADELERMAASAEGRLTLRVKSDEAEVVVPIPADFEGKGADEAFTEIAGTPYAYRVRNVFHDLPTKSGGAPGSMVSVVTVEFKTPEGTFTRFVADRADATRDLTGDGSTADPDTRIETTYAPALRAIVTVVSGPGEVGTHALISDGEAITHSVLAMGQPVPIREGLTLTLRAMRTHAFEVSRPRIVPMAQRERNARETFSMIRVRISKGDWSRDQWLEFHRYPLESEQYAIRGRMAYSPVEIQLADGRAVELLFSRKRHPLPAPIALETFELATHTGGFTGETISIRDFISRLRFKTDAGWSEAVQMSSNYPASWGGFWYFQAEWDPPAEGHAGMNYTGLGVGNRNGVHIQLAGTCIAVIGMIYAFYYKPILRRRIQAAQRERAAAGRTADDELAMAAAENAERAVVASI